jgi:hypothetical protein
MVWLKDVWGNVLAIHVFMEVPVLRVTQDTHVTVLIPRGEAGCVVEVRHERSLLFFSFFFCNLFIFKEVDTNTEKKTYDMHIQFYLRQKTFNL